MFYLEYCIMKNWNIHHIASVLQFVFNNAAITMKYNNIGIGASAVGPRAGYSWCDRRTPKTPVAGCTSRVLIYQRPPSFIIAELHRPQGHNANSGRGWVFEFKSAKNSNWSLLACKGRLAGRRGVGGAGIASMHNNEDTLMRRVNCIHAHLNW